MTRIRNTNGGLIDVIVFYPKKNIKLQPVPPSMSLEALFTPDNLTDSASDGIDGGTGCNLIFFFLLSWLLRYTNFLSKHHYCYSLSPNFTI